MSDVVSKFAHFFYCPFTGLGLRNGYRGDTWLQHRIHIFKTFVLPSIMAQSRGPIVWISWRPEEQSNPIVQAFQKSLNSIRGLSVIHTFHGVCFYDDKYDDAVAKQRLLASLQGTLPELEVHVKDQDYVLMTIQPSDDMYLSFATDRIQAWAEKGQGVCGWKKGYIMNYASKEVAEYSTVTWTQDHVSTYRTDTIPPFFTIKFPTGYFLNPQQHFDYTGPYRSHEYIADALPFYDFGEERGFVVGTHGANISTVWNHRYKGRSLSPDEQARVLLMTGTYYADPIVIPPGARHIARRILNVLPLEQSIRKVYNSLPSRWRIF